MQIIQNALLHCTPGRMEGGAACIVWEVILNSDTAVLNIYPDRTQTAVQLLHPDHP